MQTSWAAQALAALLVQRPLLHPAIVSPKGLLADLDLENQFTRKPWPGCLSLLLSSSQLSHQNKLFNHEERDSVVWASLQGLPGAGGITIPILAAWMVGTGGGDGRVGEEDEGGKGALSMLTQQLSSGSDLVDSLSDLEELFLWVSVTKGVVESDLGFSVLSLNFPQCLTHCLAT